MSIYPASIDDNDPQVVYSDGWVLVTSDPPWTGTMHSTSVMGSWARVRFTGSRVAAIFTIPTGDGQLSIATFSLDGGPAVTATGPTTPAVQFQHTLWDSGPLPLQSHLLLITNIGTQAYLRLDRIDYDPTNANAPASSSQPQAPPITQAASAQPGSAQPTSAQLTPTQLISSAANTLIPTATFNGSGSTSGGVMTIYGSGGASLFLTTQSLLSTNTTGPSISNNSGSESTSSSKSNVPVAGIVGAVLGGLLFMLLVAILLSFLRGRKSLNQEPSSGRALTGPTIPRPFSLNPYHDQGGSSTTHSSTGHLMSEISPKARMEMLRAQGNTQERYTPSLSGASSSRSYAAESCARFGSEGSEPPLPQPSTSDAPPQTFVAQTSMGQDNRTSYGFFQDAPPAYPGRPS